MTVATRRIGSAPPTRRVTLAVEGMTCTACAVRVERGLQALGDVAASVNPLTGLAAVDAPVDRSPAELCRAVESAGYVATQALSPHSAPAAAPSTALRRRVVVAVCLTLMVAYPSMLPFGSEADAAAVPATIAALPVVTWAAHPIHAAALRKLRTGVATMDLLVSAGICAATGWSVVSTVTRWALGAQASELVPSTLLMQTAAGVTAFVLLGRYLRTAAEQRAGSALTDLVSRTTKTVAVLTDSGRRMSIPAGDLRAGQRFIVRAGEAVAVDGLVVEGTSLIDAAVLTGESTPSAMCSGVAVTAGTVVRSGYLIVEAAADGTGSTLLLRAAERAQVGRGRWQQLADRLAARFVPVVMALALLTVCGWLFAGASADRALEVGLSVLVVACPCALGLATPTALSVAAGRGAQLGIFFNGHDAVARTEHVDVVAFDKTGTLTDGIPVVHEIVSAAGISRAELLCLAGAVEEVSEHPLAAAIAELARRECGTPRRVTAFTAVPGQGACGLVDGRRVHIGHLKYIASQCISISSELRDAHRRSEFDGRTTVVVAVDDVAIGVIAISDRIRESAAAAVTQLHGRGLRTILLSGDNRFAARAVGDQLGIPEIVAEVPPEQKVETIRDLQNRGLRVAMVGDGLNDGPALAISDLAIAVGSGADAAVGSADVVLLGTDLRSVSKAFDLGAATLSVIRGNLLWAGGYNLLAIPLAMAGLLNPLIAAAAMAMSSFLVIGNSVRLRATARQSSSRRSRRSGTA
ncbi:cation-translocating P-type ATPase [Nocardia sp. BSTN01]|uniref:heavy metal translocating P-type ATPase n=1 Tax=Nocardia sp. BSTN01 TaxID=2783665 RepID=UPI0018908CCC|nr:cation-translocating P-type ATPase [Nocardia sp. BSTN01]MBF4996651.1 cation-translocating P-type ATPase [Nocardia sp. BSTN01]